MSTTTVTVRNSSDLDAAIRSATSDTTILLAQGAGPFAIGIQEANKTGAHVAIRSENPDDPSVISDVFIKRFGNVTFDGVIFDSATTGASRADWREDIHISESNDIAIINSTLRSTATETVTGDPDVVRAESLGRIAMIDGFTFENNDVSAYQRGLYIANATDVSINDNTFTRFQADSIQIVNVNRLEINNNYFGEFYGSYNSISHDDFIQFWTTGGKAASRNIVINNNIFNSGDGDAQQSIYMGNEAVQREGRTEAQFFYTNVDISNNLVYNGVWNGIYVGSARDVLIENNTVVFNPLTPQLDAVEQVIGAPRIRVENLSYDVVIRDNIVEQIDAPAAAKLSNNVIVSYEDRASAGYLDKVLIHAMTGGALDPEGFRILPGSAFDGANVGAEWLQTGAPGALSATYRVEQVDGSESVLKFDARYSVTADGKPLPAGSNYVWSFADGSVMEGPVVEHAFDTPGRHAVSLSVTLPNGETDGFSARVFVADPVLLALDFNNRAVTDGSSYASVLKTPQSGAAFADGLDSPAYVLQTGAHVVAPRENRQLFSLDQFSISLAVRQNAADSHGALITLHDSFDLTVTPDQRLVFRFANAENETFSVSSAPNALIRDVWSLVQLSYDGLGGVARIYVDGEAVAEGPMQGLTKTYKFWGLTLGQEWGPSLSGLVDDVVVTSEPIAPAAAQADYRAFMARRDDGGPNDGGADDALAVKFGSAFHVESYQPRTQDRGFAAHSADGEALTLTGNAWKQVRGDFTIDADTVLSFTFDAATEGEIQGIGFARGDGEAPQNFFQLTGSQSWGLQALNLYDVADGARTFSVRVGDFFTGDFDRMVFLNDDDAGIGAEATFSQVRLTRATPEPEPTPENFTFRPYQTPIESLHRGVQDFGTAVLDSAGAIQLRDNAWKVIPLGMTVDADTLLYVDFAAPTTGEIHGVGFIRDGVIHQQNLFQLHGVQTWGDQTHAGRYDGDGDLQSYAIAVGERFTGRFDGIALVMDDDASLGGVSVFANLRLVGADLDML